MLPCTLTVNAACRASNGQSPGAYLLLAGGNSLGDIAPTSGPGSDPNNPQWTFNLTVAMQGNTYAVEAFITDTFGDVLVSDSQSITA
jgi:hypothetical protein